MIWNILVFIFVAGLVFWVFNAERRNMELEEQLGQKQRDLNALSEKLNEAYKTMVAQKADLEKLNGSLNLLLSKQQPAQCQASNPEQVKETMTKKPTRRAKE